MRSLAVDCIFAVVALLGLSDLKSVLAWDQSEGNKLPKASANLQVEIGLAGTSKVGFPSRAKVRVETQAAVHAKIEIQTIDGDGVPVVYSYADWKVDLPQAGVVNVDCYVQHGRATTPIDVRLVDENKVIIASKTVNHGQSQGDRGSVLPATQPWVVSIGGDMGVERASTRSADGSLPSFSTSLLLDAKDLPSSLQGYAGVDLVYLSTSHADWLKAVDAMQGDAIVQWVRDGGKILISVGDQGPLASTIPWLAQLLPSGFVDRLEGIDPGPLESFVASEKKLPDLIVSRFEGTNSIVDLPARTRSPGLFPLVSHRAFGLGEIQVIACDVDSEALMKWGDRKLLLEKLLGNQWNRSDDRSLGDSSMSVGYRDLSGQLRASLDLFSSVRTASLSMLGGIFFLLMLILIPADYYLFVKRIRRPGWTWFSLLLISIGSCFAIMQLAKSWKPDKTLINQFVLWDVDYLTKEIHGRSWFHLYSGSQRTMDVKAKLVPAGSLVREEKGVPIDWLGMPGKGLGCFDSSVTADRGMPTYRVNMNDAQPGIEGVGLPQAGTKTFQSSWTGSWEPPEDGTALAVRESSDLLLGQWRNSLGIPISGATVFYRNWTYLLPSQIEPDQLVQIPSEPKEMARRFQKRRITEGNERSSPWNPSDRSDMPRLIDILLFYKAAGGESYTNLTHRYLGQHDLSDHLKMDRAILMARIDRPLWKIEVQSEGQSQVVESEIDQTWIRLILPVSKQAIRKK